MNKEIEIPEGYEARIEGNKVIFELKESEDERIISQLISLVKSTGEGVVIIPTNQEELIAYLEKQKELTKEGIIKQLEEEFYACGTTPKWFHDTVQGAINHGRAEALGEIKAHEPVSTMEQKEQKSIEDAVKDITKNKEVAIKFLKSAGIMDENGELAEMYRSEQKPAEYEKPLLSKFEQAVYDCAWGKVTCKPEGETQEEYAKRWAEHFLLMVRDWADDYIDSQIELAKRKAYDKGKSDAEKLVDWSEEDEAMLETIIEDYDYLCKTWLSDFEKRIGATDLGARRDTRKQISWLKSLCPQPHWKPSEEQIKTLET